MARWIAEFHRIQRDCGSNWLVGEALREEGTRDTRIAWRAHDFDLLWQQLGSAEQAATMWQPLQREQVHVLLCVCGLLLPHVWSRAASSVASRLF